jgi:hypothetical protein
MGVGKDDNSVPHIRKEDRPASLSEPLPREKLNKDLQKIVDREDDFMEELYDGQYGKHSLLKHAGPNHCSKH